MATSLAAQLKKLQAPQTSVLIADKKRASLLFDPKEAANYDRQTIYELGVAGLEELKTLNARFSEFDATLFDLSSLGMERAVHLHETNIKLNNNIRKFFHLLSPYFLLKPAHKALEWLIHRFHIHQYNADELLMLALPYHESRIFIRVVQLIDLSDKSSRWIWLEAVQKKGISLSKTVLVNHAFSNPSFLSLLCKTTMGAVKEHGQYGGVLSTLLAFYSTTVIGVLDRGSKGASETQMVSIIETLQLGLGSPVLDFAAASYMVFGRLLVTTSLTRQVLDQLVTRITSKAHIELHTEKAMLLTLTYQSQKQNITNVPFKCISRLASQKGTAVSFGTLASKGFDVVPFLVPLMRGALKEIKTQVVGSTSGMRHLIESLLNEVRFSDASAEQVVRMFIEAFDVSALEGVTEVPLVAIGEINTPEKVTEWYSGILKQLERSYPSVFDKAVGRALKGLGVTQSQAAGLRQMLGFELQLDLYDKLHHAKSRIRAEALLRLAKQHSSLKEKDENTLKDSLLGVLADDSALVVLAAFSFPLEVLQRILSRPCLHSRLVQILQTHILDKSSGSKWVNVIPSVISALTFLGAENKIEELESLVALLPHMLINEDYTMKVLESPFGSKSQFVKCLKSGSGNGKKVYDNLCNVINNGSGAVPLQSVLEFGRKLLQEPKHTDLLESKFSLLLLLGSAVPQKASVLSSLEVLELATQLIKGHKVCASTKSSQMTTALLSQCLSLCKKGFIPLEGYMHVVKSVLKRTALNLSLTTTLWLDLDTQSSTTKFLVQLYCLLLKGSAVRKSESSSLYAATLHMYFKTYFPSPRTRLNFLANFWSYHRVLSGSDSEDRRLSLTTQVRSLRLSALLLKKQDDLSEFLNLSPSNTIIPALLTALCCPSFPVRKAALEVVGVLAESRSGQTSYMLLVKQIKKSEQELHLDAEQLQLVLYTTLSPDPIVQSMLSKGDSTSASNILNTLLEVVINKETPSYISAAILNILTSVNSEGVLKKLLPQVLEIMAICKNSSALNLHISIILSNIINRIDAQTACVFESDTTWKAVTELLSNHTTVVFKDGKASCPAEITCHQITRELWDSLPKPQSTIQLRLLSLLVSAGTEAENPTVLSAVTKCVKQLTIDASIVVTELTKMKDASVQSTNSTQLKRRISVAAPSLQILQTKEWRCGMTLLELLQNKKKLNNVHLLLPVLFDLLKKCLYFEEQAPLEYAKQLLLSCILHCCQKLSPDGTSLPSKLVPTQVLDIETIVHCVRGTQNPQTHHHALLLLAHAAALVPEQVLLNVMAIFTFMGSVVLRQDDAYSFQVITKVVDTIIPVVIKASTNSSKYHFVDSTIASIMRVFVDALLDIPEHRRLSLFHKLLTTLDPQQYLWLFLCLVMESHTEHHTDDSKRSGGSRADSEAPKRIEVALQIVTQFVPETILLNCVRVLRYLLTLPMEKGAANSKSVFKNIEAVGDLAKYQVKSLFDVDHHTPKQLRHYKYTIVTFISALLSSLPFVNQITSMDEAATDVLVPAYMEFLEVLLALIQIFSRQSDSSVGTPTAKYWKVMVAQVYDILDKVNALLPSKLFLNIVSGLMTHELPSLRRKAMELLNSRLSFSQREMFLTSCNSADLLVLLEPLSKVVGSIETLRAEEINEEVFLNQQTALLSIKYLAKHMAYENYEKFKPILEYMTSLICKGQIQNSNLLASVVLCAAELCSSLRAHAIVSLPVLMPAFIKLLAAQITQTPDVVQVSLAASLYRIVESLAAFISPYLRPLLVELCSLSSSQFHEDEDLGKAAQVGLKLKSTRQKLSAAVPTRVLVPAVESAYKDLVSRKRLDAVGPLMSVLAENFVGLISADLVALQTQLTDFFLSALQFRSTCGDDISAEHIDGVENHVIKALVAFVLKLSETSFRPLYFKFFDWATRLQEHKERTITFYKLSCGVAESLKGLYVSFAGHLLKNAASLLDQCNVSKVGEKDTEDFLPVESSNDVRYEDLYFGDDPCAEEKCNTLVTNILRTLHYVFLYDSQNFLSKERFETLMQPIVDQLENTLGGVEGLRNRASDIVVPCVAQMAVACTDDTLWKQLNYQILLKTRHSTPMVRMVSLEAVCAVARKLGEGFLPLLPETVPFLAELLEDEEESIETACRRAVQDLEQVLGEPIQKYF